MKGGASTANNGCTMNLFKKLAYYSYFWPRKDEDDPPNDTLFLTTKKQGAETLSCKECKKSAASSKKNSRGPTGMVIAFNDHSSLSCDASEPNNMTTPQKELDSVTCSLLGRTIVISDTDQMSDLYDHYYLMNDASKQPPLPPMQVWNLED